MSDIKCTTGGRERISQAVGLFSEAFKDDPVIIYMLQSLSQEARYAYMRQYYTSLMTAAGLNNALFQEANDFQSSAVVLPPGKRVDNPFTLIQAGIIGALFKIGIGGCWRMLGEYEPLCEVAKRKVFSKGQKHYYVFHIATAAEARGRGLCSALLRGLQQRAGSEGMPIWLEATTPYSAKQYERLGFETVENMVLGEGKANPDGRAEAGGKGVPVVGMAWWPVKEDVTADESQ